MSLDLLANNAALGALYTAAFALSAAPLVVGTLLALVLAPKSRAVWLCVGAVAAELAAVLVNGGDWMPHHRLLAVYAPLLAITLGIAAERLTAYRRPALLAAGAVLLVGATALAWQEHVLSQGPTHMSTRATAATGPSARRCVRRWALQT